ncbi:MAG: hypothetical protein HY318_16250 [Armatimonadetes bacterium]|nr:hypothetical protein [Armatimonadota bacterium]
MTSRQRILATLRGDPADRVPVWAWGIHPWLGEVHPSLRPVVEAYLESADLVHWWSPGSGTFLTGSDQVQARVERCLSDLEDYEEQVTVYSTPAGELTERSYVSPKGRPGYCRKHLLETEADVEKLLSIPYVPPRPDCSSFFQLEQKLGERGMVMVSVPSDPMYLFNNLTGSETFGYWSIERRDLIRSMIDVFLRRLKDWIEWVLSQGVGPLFGYVGPELCIPPLQSPGDFEEWVVGPDREINDLIHASGGIALVHCHGCMGPVLEGFVRMHADALHPIEPPPMGDVTLGEAKRRVGGDLCIVGNVQHHDLCTRPNDQFRDLVEETVRTGMSGGRYILSPTATPFGWPTMTDLERENWLAMLEVGLEAGRY